MCLEEIVESRKTKYFQNRFVTKCLVSTSDASIVNT